MKHCPQCKLAWEDAEFCPIHGARLVGADVVADAPARVAALRQLVPHKRPGAGKGWMAVALIMIVVAGVAISHPLSKSRPSVRVDPALAGMIDSASRATSQVADTPLTRPLPPQFQLLARPRVDQRAIDREEILNAIRRADRAETDALRTSTEAPLDAAFSGYSLSIDVNRVRSNRRAGAYEENTLLDVTLESVTVASDRRRARAEVVEAWETTRRAVETNDCVSRRARHTTPQTVFFVRRENSWLVDSIAFGTTTGATTTACGSSATTTSSTGFLKIENNSRYAIHHLYMSLAIETKWGLDQLGDAILAPGRTFTLTNVAPNKYDIKFVDEDGDACVLRNIAIDGQTSWSLTTTWLLRCESK